MKSHFNTVIIGAGVAGMTAALYLKRAGIDCVLLESSAPGGQVLRTGDIENYPGFLSIAGPDFALHLMEQLDKVNNPYQYGEVIDVQIKPEKKVICTDGTITFDYLCIASGRNPKKLGVPGEEKFIGHGISYCATCDGPMYKDRDVIVVGGGDSALKESLFLSKICKKVTIIYRKDRFSRSEYLINLVKKCPNIEVMYSSEILEFHGSDHVESALVTTPDGEKELTFAAVFIFIGSIPNTNFLKHLDILDKNGYIIVDENRKTSIPGVVAAGDVIAKSLYQVVTAVSDGAIAAQSIIDEE